MRRILISLSAVIGTSFALAACDIESSCAQTYNPVSPNPGNPGYYSPINPNNPMNYTNGGIYAPKDC